MLLNIMFAAFRNLSNLRLVLCQLSRDWDYRRVMHHIINWYFSFRFWVVPV